MNTTCPICQGIGLEKRDAIRCPCPYNFCYKCENRSGFVIKPFEECRKCYGSGRIDITVIPSTLEKPLVKPSTLEKPLIEPSTLEKPLVEPKGFKNN